MWCGVVCGMMCVCVVWCGVCMCVWYACGVCYVWCVLCVVCVFCVCYLCDMCRVYCYVSCILLCVGFVSYGEGGCVCMCVHVIFCVHL